MWKDCICSRCRICEVVIHDLHMFLICELTHHPQSRVSFPRSCARSWYCLHQIIYLKYQLLTKSLPCLSTWNMLQLSGKRKNSRENTSMNCLYCILLTYECVQLIEGVTTLRQVDGPGWDMIASQASHY